MAPTETRRLADASRTRLWTPERETLSPEGVGRGCCTSARQTCLWAGFWPKDRRRERGGEARNSPGGRAIGERWGGGRVWSKQVAQHPGELAGGVGLACQLIHLERVSLEVLQDSQEGWGKVSGGSGCRCGGKTSEASKSLEAKLRLGSWSLRPSCLECGRTLFLFLDSAWEASHRPRGGKATTGGRDRSYLPGAPPQPGRASFCPPLSPPPPPPYWCWFAAHGSSALASRLNLARPSVLCLHSEGNLGTITR